MRHKKRDPQMLILVDPRRVLDLADRARRLPAPSHRDPEAFHIARSELAAELRNLADAGTPRVADWPRPRQVIALSRTLPPPPTASAVPVQPAVSAAPSKPCTCSAHRPRPRRRRRYRVSPMVRDPRQPALQFRLE
jgi:hypothetical protein